MSKQDWPALLPAGMHVMPLERLESIALNGDLATHRRIELFARLSVFIQALSGIGCYAEIWIDGSFTTTKPDPSDIDLAIFLQEDKLAGLSSEQEATLESLLDRPTSMERYGIDVYVESYGEFHRAAYWRGVFGFCHDEVTPKGVVVIECAP